MNSKRESSFNLSEADNLSVKRYTNQITKNPDIFNERTSQEFRFLKLKSRISNKFKRDGIPKFSLIRNSKDGCEVHQKRFSDNIAQSQLKKNECDVKFKTTNIKKIVKKSNPSIERFKTNVKEVCSGKINLT